MTSWLLLVVNVVMVTILIVVWRRGEQRVAEPANLSIPPLELPDLAAMNSTPVASVDVAGIRDQAAFYASRNFYVPPVVPTQAPPPDYDFNGSLRLPGGKRTAFVKKRGDSISRRLHVGDDLDGWHVDQIEADHVVLGLNGQSAELSSARGGSFTSGLIRTTGGPRPPLTGIHILGSPGIAATANGGPQSTSQRGRTEARFYQPTSQTPK